MCLNVSLEYEKTEVHSGFFWSNAEDREKLIASERAFTDDKVQQIIDFKRKVCTKENGKNFVIVNGERIPLACGGNQLNSVDNLNLEDMGFAKKVYEQTLGDDKYTFIDGVENPFSCTILIKG